MALAIAFGLVAAACGDDDESAETTETTAAATETTEAEETTETTEAAEGDGGETSDVEGDVFVTGSSTVEPISVKVAENFEAVAPNVNVSVEGPGTGDGFVKFCAGEADVQDASRPIKDEEAADCEAAGIEYVEIKVAYDGLAVITNPANDAITCLSLEDLYALFGPESTGFSSWADAQALATELGSTTTFPDAPLDITAPGTESGTYDAFLEIALGDILEARIEAGVITEDDEGLRPDYASSADDNTIISNIEASETSLGFVGLAFAEEAGDLVKELEIDGGDGCVAPNAETTASGEYPIARDLFIYVSVTAAQENPAVAAFVDFYVSQLATVAAEVGYVTMSDDDLAAAEAAWADAAS
jgi:phosphate transport system substrate-binding protein